MMHPEYEFPFMRSGDSQVNALDGVTRMLMGNLLVKLHTLITILC